MASVPIPRFEGEGMDPFLLDDDRAHDAADLPAAVRCS